MNDQIILAVDEEGNFTGEYIPKAVGHTGTGHRHLAIAVLLYNDKGQVLLQKRKHRIFNDIWDVTGATHPLHLDTKDESLDEATWRCLDREYGINEQIPLQNFGMFNYYAKYDEMCENEHCASMVGEYNGQLSLNPEVGYEYKWMNKQDFLKDVYATPENYSPWAVEMVKVLEKNNFFK